MGWLFGSYDGTAIPADVAQRIYDYIDKNMVVPVAGPDGDLSSGTLAEFAKRHADITEAIKGGTGNAVHRYIESVKKLLSAYVLELRVLADDARKTAAVAFANEMNTASDVAQTGSDTENNAAMVRSEAENINLEPLTDWNQKAWDDTSDQRPY